jgi:hypothetical protein
VLQTVTGTGTNKQRHIVWPTMILIESNVSRKGTVHLKCGVKLCRSGVSLKLPGNLAG